MLRTRSTASLGGLAVLLISISPLWAAGLAEKKGEELAAMLGRGEPVGRIEARWESALGELGQAGAFVALESFMRHGLADPLARLSPMLAEITEHEARTKAQELERLARSKGKTSRSRLIAIETGISELADLLRGAESRLGDSGPRADLRRQRIAVETLGRTARDLRRTARRSFETK